ncbi:hypothetical protein STEG23_021877 [Scotinomys teguina]
MDTNPSSTPGFWSLESPERTPDRDALLWASHKPSLEHIVLTVQMKELAHADNISDKLTSICPPITALPNAWFVKLDFGVFWFDVGILLGNYTHKTEKFVWKYEF